MRQLSRMKDRIIMFAVAAPVAVFFSWNYGNFRPGYHWSERLIVATAIGAIVGYVVMRLFARSEKNE